MALIVISQNFDVEFLLLWGCMVLFLVFRMKNFIKQFLIIGKLLQVQGNVKRSSSFLFKLLMQ